MKEPQVSVVITTYNRLGYLKEAVASVKAQTFTDWELLIVDDASGDGTWQWLTSLVKDNGKIRTFRQDVNEERSEARNQGLDTARGKFIMFLDDDDRLQPNALSDLVKPLKANEELIAAVGARWRFLNDDSHRVKVYHPPLRLNRTIWPELIFGWGAISGQNLYRTQIARDVKGFSSKFLPAEDRQFWLKVAREGPVALVPQATVEYRSHDGQWKPENIVEIREMIFFEFLEQLPERERKRGERLRESGRWATRGHEAYWAGKYRASIPFFIRACATAPEVLFSPLIGYPIVRGIVRAAIFTLLLRSR